MEESSKNGIFLFTAVVGTAAVTSLLTYALLRHLDIALGSNDSRHPPPTSSSSALCDQKTLPIHSQPDPPPLHLPLTPSGHATTLPPHRVERRRADPFDPAPRQGYLPWDDYFMALAFLSAERSKDPNKQVGACIVNQQRVICGIGYNGFPRGCGDNALPWAKKSSTQNPLDTKYPYVVHAEANALLNVNSASVEGASVYVTMFPCNECAKLLIQAGIHEVVYHEGKVQERVGGDPSPSPSPSPSPLPLVTRAPALAHEERALISNDRESHTCHHHQGVIHSHGHSSDVSTPAKIKHDGGGAGGGGGGGDVMCYEASLKLLTMAGVKIRQHQLRRRVVLGPEGWA